MSASNPAPEPTEIAGRFEVVQKLGAGAFGTVYKARDRLLGRLLAIKTIRMEGLAASQAGLGELLERFRREAQVAARLKHPSIVTIYDIGESEGWSYISMELIDGIGLDRVITESGRIPVERAAGLAAQVADALDFAHRSGVVHRDIKPANILIEPGDRVKVTDFGIAKPTDSAEHLTMTGSLLGTPSYMSPEQARGAALDGRSDLFSLGCVLYEMVAGRRAFRGESITALLFKIITEEPPPIRELDPLVPDHLVEIIARSIAKAPENRYQTGRELADDLLTLARPGSLPTLRSLDAQTLPLAPAGEPAALSPATDGATRSSASTLARESASTRPPAPALPAPAMRTPAAATTGRPARATVRATPAPALRKPAAPATRSRGGSPRALGLSLVAVLVLGGLGVGARAFLARRASGPTPVESPRGHDAGEPPTPARPEQTVQGSAAGEALAQKYGSGESGGLSISRFTRRSRLPARISLPERAAVATLAHVLSAEQAYQKASGGYGTLQQLQHAGLLRLDVPFAHGVFQRARYRFQLTGGPGEFKVTAAPLTLGPRPFIVDQSGSIRVDE